jgi:single-strand DNA-binding protein
VLNKVILIGRLTRDPKLRYTPNGHAVGSFTLAVNRPFKTENGEQQTDFIDVVAWRKVAEQVGQYLSKGRLVAVDGRLQIRSYEDRNGVKRKAAEVVASTVRFLDGRKPTTATDASAATPEETPAQDPEAVPAGAGGSDADVPF